MTTNPIAVLDVDDARELLRAIGGSYPALAFTSEQYGQFRLRSPAGFRIIEQLQHAVREYSAAQAGEGGN